MPPTQKQSTLGKRAHDEESQSNEEDHNHDDDCPQYDSCIFKFTRGKKKGEICQGEIDDENFPFCTEHCETPVALAFAHPCTFKNKKTKLDCGKLRLDDDVFCKRHSKKNLVYCKSVDINGERCKRPVREDSEFCNSHTICTSCETNKCHRRSLELCLDCDETARCSYRDPDTKDWCRGYLCKQSETHCLKHYRMFEANTLCQWPAGCKSKPDQLSDKHYCVFHGILYQRVQCDYIEIHKPTGQLRRCKDHKCGDDDFFCKRHNLMTSFPTESLNEGFDDRVLELGRQIHECLENGRTLEAVQLTKQDRAFAIQLLFHSRKSAYIDNIKSQDTE